MAERPRAVEDLVLKHLFGGTYAGRKVLVTGHTGFKGSWLCLWLAQLGAEVTGLALPPDTEPSHWRLLRLDSVREHLVDLRERAAVERAVTSAAPEIVFHLAAQPLVRRGYSEPALTFETNVLGLVNLLETLRVTRSVKALVNVTTDKVYREAQVATGYPEDHPLGGHDPYSTSKACSELVTECYRLSFFAEAGLYAATARAGNVIGGGDWSEDRLVPDFVRAASVGQAMKLRNPNAVRPWQHVLEPLSGYLRLGQTLLAGTTGEGAWNFGPTQDATLSVQKLVTGMQSLWPVLKVEPQPGKHPWEANVLLLDSAKARRELGWHPVWSVDATLKHTLDWYHAYYKEGRVQSRDDLAAYVSAAAGARLPWAA